MIVVKEKGAAEAWRILVKEVLQRSGVAAPAVLEIGPDTAGIDSLSNSLDKFLREMGYCSTNETKNTIFPSRQSSRNIKELTKWYRDSYLPKYRARKAGGGKETYFSRFTGIPRKGEEEGVNQLKFVIDLWNERKRGGKARPRRSGLQLSVRNPAIDQSRTSMVEFPCLQQVAVTYADNIETRERELKLQAFYPSQYLVKRSFGNYLGLLELGSYIASQCGESFGGLTCFTGILHRDVKVNELKSISDAI